jgi:hypothetical protein
MHKADVEGAFMAIKVAAALVDRATERLDYAIQELHKATQGEPVDDEHISLNKIVAIVIEELDMDLAWAYEGLRRIEEYLKTGNREAALKMIAR